MIHSLIGKVNINLLHKVEAKTALRFKDPTQFKLTETVLMYEHGMVNEDILLECAIQEYGRVVQTPALQYVPKDIISRFADYDMIVIGYDVSADTVTVGMIPEHIDSLDSSIKLPYKVRVIPIPIYYYVKVKTEQTGAPDFVYALGPTDIFDLIVEEAMMLKASDITISSTSKGAIVYYNARKTRVNSKCFLTTGQVSEIALLLAGRSGAELADMTSKPRFFSVEVNSEYRGRTVINKTHYGYLVTLRMLSNDVLDTSLEKLNISPDTCEFIRSKVLSREKGLRLFIGETMSGKNTTILSALTELIALKRYKIVSVEQPVEILVDGLEQIDAETDEEFARNADSLLRQNPDHVYFTEITARTATSIMQQANTAKAVYSSIHANSISDVLFRLQDITRMDVDRLLLTLHSCVYQELVRDDFTDTVKPVNRCVYFSDELKMKLYGQDTATIKSVLQQEERAWEMARGKE